MTDIKTLVLVLMRTADVDEESAGRKRSSILKFASDEAAG